MNSEEDRPDLRRSRGRIYVVDRHDDDYIQRDLGGGVLVASGGGSRMGGRGRGGGRAWMGERCGQGGMEEVEEKSHHQGR